MGSRAAYAGGCSGSSMGSEGKRYPIASQCGKTTRQLVVETFHPHFFRFMRIVSLLVSSKGMNMNVGRVTSPGTSVLNS